MICFALAKSGKVAELTTMVTADGKPIPHVAQAAFPMMVKYLLPVGLRGIVVAGLLSALMGSLAGVFNACSTLFTVDLYEKWKPGASQHQIVRTGRIATTIMVVIAILWIPVVQGAHSLYNYLQSVQGYLAPPIFVVFFFGVFWKRLNAKGCLWAMVVGFTIGLFRMLVDTPVAPGVVWLRRCREDHRTWIRGRVVAVDNQQYLLPVFQRADNHYFGCGNGCGQLYDERAGLQEDKELDLRHGDCGRPHQDAGKLGLARRGGLGGGAAVHSGCLSVFQGIVDSGQYFNSKIKRQNAKLRYP